VCKQGGEGGDGFEEDGDTLGEWTGVEPPKPVLGVVS
jgi:hypothetical protein